MNLTDSQWYDIYVEGEYLAVCTDANTEQEAIEKVVLLMNQPETKLFGVVHNFTIDPREG